MEAWELVKEWGLHWAPVVVAYFVWMYVASSHSKVAGDLAASDELKGDTFFALCELASYKDFLFNCGSHFCCSSVRVHSNWDQITFRTRDIKATNPPNPLPNRSRSLLLKM
jgi:hypothetical protein